MGSKEDKKASETQDGVPIFQAIDRAKKYGTKEELDSLIVQLKEALNETGKIFLNRALSEGLFTEKEWEKWQTEYSYNIADIGVVLQAHYGRVDGHMKPDKGDTLTIFIITMPDSPIHRSRKMLKKRFNIQPKTAKELTEKMKKDPEFRKELKKSGIEAPKKLREVLDKANIPEHPFNWAG